MCVGVGVDQLHADAHPVPGALHVAFEHLGHAELLANLLDGELCVSELLDGCAGNDPERADLRKLREDVIVDAIHEKSVIRFAAPVLKRQDRDRGARVGRRRG